MEGILTNNFNKDENWTINLDGYELSIVKEHLNMLESEKMQTVISAAKILGQCSNPKGNKSQKTGLAIGKVQSGKTSNFISLAALAYDNNYRIVIIFGGKTLPLLAQTEERINEYFDLNKREDYKFSAFSSNNTLKSDTLKNSYFSRKNIMITGLKEYTHIERIKNFINDAGLSDVPILIIDDEGDQMSLNGKVNKNLETTTYKKFKELITQLDFSSFISVTATPQANLLIDICNILSPDFIELITPGINYSGFNTFHNSVKTEYISIIPDNENIILDENSGIPKSFVESLSTFYVGSIIRKKRGDMTPHSMLIHPSQLIKHHEIVEKKLKILKDQLSDYVYSCEPASIEHVKNFINLGINNLKSTVSELYDASDLIEDFEIELLNTSIQKLNGDEDAPKELDYTSHRNVIVIGGSMVERGLTIKNLTVTYIVRTNKGKENADTVEQRTRWFGYRLNKYGSYLDVCRIYLTNSIAQKFYDLSLHEKSIWNNIIEQQKKGVKAKNMQFTLDLSSHFNPTRRNVLSNVSELKLGNWKNQKSISNLITTGLYKNMNDLIKEFLKKYKYEDIKVGNFIHRVYQDVDIKEFYHEIIVKLYSKPELGFDIANVKNVINRLELDDLPLTTKITIMRYGINEYRTIDEVGNISNLMQGFSVGLSKDNPEYYPGDGKAIYDVYGDVIQFQIHNIKITKQSINTIPVLCFYCPLINNSSRLVGRITC